MNEFGDRKKIPSEYYPLKTTVLSFSQKKKKTIKTIKVAKTFSHNNTPNLNIYSQIINQFN